MKSWLQQIVSPCDIAVLSEGPTHLFSLHTWYLSQGTLGVNALQQKEEEMGELVEIDEIAEEGGLSFQANWRHAGFI